MAGAGQARASRHERSREKPKNATESKKHKDWRRLTDVTKGIRKKVMATLRDKLDAAVFVDPDMWPWVENIMSSAVDAAWSDLEHEVERNLDRKRENQLEEHNPRRGPEGSILSWPYYRLRAFVLSHYLPHNRSIYGKFKDPVYMLLYILTLLPIPGLRVGIFTTILLMLLVPGPPDEFQLINFILLFKGMQFLTSGLINLGMASIQYFSCYTFYKESLLQCIDAHGPGTGSHLVDYLGSILLVWVAFGMLGWSHKVHQRRKEPDVPEVDVHCLCFTFRGRKMRGGRLQRLVRWDMIFFAISCATLLLLTLCTCDLDSIESFRILHNDAQFQANVFWSLTLYSLSSFPFLFFEIGLFQKLMTHCDVTGFNKHGACVLFQLPPKECSARGEEEGEAEESEPNWGWTVVYTAAGVAKIAQRGRVARGGERHDGIRPFDFTMGVLVSARRMLKGQACEAETDTSPNEPAMSPQPSGGAASFVLGSAGSPIGPDSHSGNGGGVMQLRWPTTPIVPWAASPSSIAASQSAEAGGSSKMGLEGAEEESSPLPGSSFASPSQPLPQIEGEEMSVSCSIFRDESLGRRFLNKITGWRRRHSDPVGESLIAPLLPGGPQAAAGEHPDMVC